MSENLSDTLQCERGLQEALIRNTLVVEQHTEQLKAMAKAMHTPPCPHVAALDARVTALERSSGRFSDLFWKVVAALATAAALAMWKVGG